MILGKCATIATGMETAIIILSATKDGPTTLLHIGTHTMPREMTGMLIMLILTLMIFAPTASISEIVQTLAALEIRDLK